MNSPDCWQLAKGLYPGYRGYAATFAASLNPIGGEYLEIPSTTGLQQGINAAPCFNSKTTRGPFEYWAVSLLTSFSVEVAILYAYAHEPNQLCVQESFEI